MAILKLDGGSTKKSSNKTTTNKKKTNNKVSNVLNPNSSLGISNSSWKKPAAQNVGMDNQANNQVNNKVYQTTYAPSGSGNLNGGNSYLQSLFDYFKEKNEKARQASLNAIMSKLKMGEQQYNDNINDISAQYQSLRNQSEVERYKSQRSLREALANRGQLNSGLGRQEQLLLDTQYGNAINSLNTQEAKEKNEVKNLIAQLRAEAELEKANIQNQYNTAIESFRSQMGA